MVLGLITIDTTGLAVWFESLAAEAWCTELWDGAMEMMGHRDTSKENELKVFRKHFKNEFKSEVLCRLTFNVLKLVQWNLTNKCFPVKARPSLPIAPTSVSLSDIVLESSRGVASRSDISKSFSVLSSEISSSCSSSSMGSTWGMTQTLDHKEGEEVEEDISGLLNMLDSRSRFTGVWDTRQRFCNATDTEISSTKSWNCLTDDLLPAEWERSFFLWVHSWTTIVWCVTPFLFCMIFFSDCSKMINRIKFCS